MSNVLCSKCYNIYIRFDRSHYHMLHIHSSVWSQIRGPGSIPDQSLWDLWWDKWHWDRFYSNTSVFTIRIISPVLHIHRAFIYIMSALDGSAQ